MSKTIMKLLWSVPTMIGIGIVFVYLWLFACLFLAFSDPMQYYNFCSCGVLFLLVWGIILASIWHWKKVRKCLLFLLLVPPLFSGSVELIHYLRVGQYTEMRSEIPWFRYRPFRNDSLVQSVVAEDQYKIASDFPKTMAALALYPLTSGIAESLYIGDTKDFWNVNEGGSDYIYEQLLNGGCDMIISARPSAKQVGDAGAKDLTYTITPFAKEAFVFFVRKDNPVNNLTREQIREIYSGSIRNWREVGSDQSVTITAYQRNEGSGSQTMLQKIMGNTPIMSAPQGTKIGDMGGIVTGVANYRNKRGALGFSFRVYCQELLKDDDIKLLSIDGIAPTPENIRNGSYPYIADCCVITVKPRSEAVNKIVSFLLSPAGRELIKKNGYVPL